MENERLLQIKRDVEEWRKTGKVPQQQVDPNKIFYEMDRDLMEYNQTATPPQNIDINDQIERDLQGYTPEQPKQMGFGEQLAYSTAKPFVKLGLSAAKGLEKIGIGGGLNERGQILEEQYGKRGYDTDINSLREGIGALGEAAATTFTGEAVLGAGKNILANVAKGTAPGIKAVLPLAGSGAIQGAAQGVSEALQDDEQSVANYLGKSITYGLTGAVLNPLTQVGLPNVVRGMRKLFKATPIATDLSGNAFNKEQSKVVEKRLNVLSPVVSKYKNLSKFRDEAVSKYKFDPLDWLVKTDILSGSTDDTGTLVIRGEGNALDKFRKFVEPQEGIVSDVLRNENRAIDADELEDILRETLQRNYKYYNLTGEQLEKADQKIAATVRGLIRKSGSIDVPVSLLHDEKVAMMSPLNYNLESRAIDKAVANALKETVEKNTDSAEVRAVNKELQKYYIIEDFLGKLDGKKIEGGKLGKYFAQTLGAMAGSKFGPLGTLAGAEIGGSIKGSQLERALSGELGNQIPIPKDIIKAATASITPNKTLNLPSPKAGAIQSGKVVNPNAINLPEGRIKPAKSRNMVDIVRKK